MIKDLYTETKTNKLSEILSNKEGLENRTMIRLEDMEFLLKRKGKEIEFNKEVGTCYYHTIEYGGRTFFNITGAKIKYDKTNKTLTSCTHHSK